MRKQEGMTLIGMLLTALIAIVGAVLVMRIVPVYVQYYEVKSSISALNDIKNISSEDPDLAAEALKSKLMNQFYVNSIEDIKAEQVKIKPIKDTTYLVNVKYQVIRPLISNISIMFDFDESQEVTIASN